MCDQIHIDGEIHRLTPELRARISSEQLVPYLAFSMFAIPLPLAPIQILANRPRSRDREARPAGSLHRRATTARLSAVIAMQIVNVFLCRSPDRSSWATELRGNPPVLWGALLLLEELCKRRVRAKRRRPTR